VKYDGSDLWIMLSACIILFGDSSFSHAGLSACIATKKYSCWLLNNLFSSAYLWCVPIILLQYFRAKQAVVRPPQYAPTPCKWCRWHGPSFSVPIPSLKYVGLPVLKIWLIFSHLQIQSRVIRIMGFFPANIHLSMPFCSRFMVRHRLMTTFNA